MLVETLQAIAQQRRSIYALNKHLPISEQAVSDIVQHALKHTPSSFNSQSTRVVLLFGLEHERLWGIVSDELSKIVPAEAFESTQNKLNSFKAAAGSVLFFEDEQTIQGLQEQFPTYAAQFPIWAEHTNAMMQYAVWTTLSAAKVGANLQHYNPIIDAQVAQAWSIPQNWTLRAQLVFGGISEPAAEKEFQDLDSRFKVYGM